MNNKNRLPTDIVHLVRLWTKDKQSDNLAILATAYVFESLADRLSFDDMAKILKAAYDLHVEKFEQAHKTAAELSKDLPIDSQSKIDDPNKLN